MANNRRARNKTFVLRRHVSVRAFERCCWHQADPRALLLRVYSAVEGMNRWSRRNLYFVFAATAFDQQDLRQTISHVDLFPCAPTGTPEFFPRVLPNENEVGRAIESLHYICVVHRRCEWGVLEACLLRPSMSTKDLDACCCGSWKLRRSRVERT